MFSENICGNICPTEGKTCEIRGEILDIDLV